MDRIRTLKQRTVLKIREIVHFSLLKIFAFFYRLGNWLIAFGWTVVAWSVQQALNHGAVLEPVEDRNDREVIDRFQREV